MDTNETVESLKEFTVTLLVLSGIPYEMRGMILDRVVAEFNTYGYMNLLELRKIIYEYEEAVNPEATLKVGPYDDLYGWARI